MLGSDRGCAPGVLRGGKLPVAGLPGRPQAAVVCCGHRPVDLLADP
ncbi:MAG: hypothetical protein ACK6AD_00465 [Cyanobacteriota bacterium]